MKMEDMILISVDDHVVEPPDAFERHAPAKYKDRMPKVVKGAGGEDLWAVEDMTFPNMALNAVVGRRKEEYGMEPTCYEQLRTGTYDVKARVDDMNVNGVLSSLNFPSVPGVCGQNLERLKDKNLAYAIVQTWNDWHILDWCQAAPGRFIPMGIVPTWDAELAAEEVKRISALGCHAIVFPPNPNMTGMPSLQNEFWDPLWKACADNNVNICMHISDPSMSVPSTESPVDVFITNLPISLYATASDLTFSAILRKYPNIRFSLSEGGSGWIPHFKDRADFVNKQHIWTNQDFGGRKPSEVFSDHVFNCFIYDPVAVKLRKEIGVDTMMWECDYPHSDTTWPQSPEVLWESMKEASDDEINKITHENAMRAYNFNPFEHLKKEDCTVGALREKAKHVDLSYTDTSGAGIPPAKHDGVVTYGDILKQLAGTHAVVRED
ncbi:amidohydrolase [Aestuariicella hydrocarbonica]|uniref:Amidohydrolase n=1 Tax=Pseudomaricurvus hydrocarbonicus TaxID=1470433 RepID=A0A9E5MMH5_9GAMM|nr:amidohydrolase family protein [Aestuariicella hydrocarbonica]NHO66650.1 amidohydrolase [Aestuariicella hydrocarbonica]